MIATDRWCSLLSSGKAPTTGEKRRPAPQPSSLSFNCCHCLEDHSPVEPESRPLICPHRPLLELITTCRWRTVDGAGEEAPSTVTRRRRDVERKENFGPDCPAFMLMSMVPLQFLFMCCQLTIAHRAVLGPSLLASFRNSIWLNSNSMIK